MTHEQIKAMYQAWESIEDAENAIGEFLYGDSPEECSLADVLGDLIDRNAQLSRVIAGVLGESVESVRAKILQGERDKFGIVVSVPAELVGGEDDEPDEWMPLPT